MQVNIVDGLYKQIKKVVDSDYISYVSVRHFVNKTLKEKIVRIERDKSSGLKKRKKD